MNTKSLAKLERDFTPIIELVTDGLGSKHSKIAYRKALSDFIAWFDRERRPGLNKAVVQRYKTYLLHETTRGDKPRSAAAINLRLSAIRKLASEAADNGFISPSVASGIEKVKGIATSGIRTGNWLTKDQAQKLLNAPNIETLKGLRDRAILAAMVGGGLRRSEIACLTIDHIQQRDARWVIVDIVGKRNHVRCVPIPTWTKKALDEWIEAANITQGNLFRSIRRGNHIVRETISDQAVQDVVKEYAAICGYKISAHDLRRTFAKLAHKGGAGLDQIQLSLGHASLKTTERYLGIAQDLIEAPCDKLGLRIDWR